MFWAVPAFDLQSLYTVDSGLTAREGPQACRLTQGPSSHLHLECFFFFFSPTVRKSAACQSFTLIQQAA